jgi:uncharacterized protein
MKILSVSDVVVPQLTEPRFKDRFSDVEMILSCGDLSPEYLFSLKELISAPLYYVRGNHDIRYLNKPPIGCNDIHGRVVRHKGIKILGLEGSRWYNGGPIQYREHEMVALIRRLRLKLWLSGGVDIVITHAPIRFVNDAEDRCHRGFECYLKLIDRYDPLYFIHGHIHRHFESPLERITSVKNTKVVNTYGYTILEIGPEKT